MQIASARKKESIKIKKEENRKEKKRKEKKRKEKKTSDILVSKEALDLRQKFCDIAILLS